MTTRTKWGLVWTGWVAYFAVAEAIAIRTGEYDAPLTAHMRHTLGAKKHPVIRTAGQVALLGGVVWLVDHLYRGIDP